MYKKKETIPKEDASKIIGIQFSILSPEEIRKGSVVEITSRDTYINNKPVIGGLFDPRMGVLEPGLICPTDGLDYMQTPGYFGHIELARPVFYIQYLATVVKILRCVCIKCSKLLISKEKYREVLTKKPDDRWLFVFSIASKIKRCGEDIEDGCGCKQPNKIKKEGLATITAEWDSIDGIEGDEKEKLEKHMTPEVVIKEFRRISDEDVSFMGFNPIWSRPEWMICQVLAVPPPTVRPSVKHDAQQRSEDDISHILMNIIKANKTLQDKLQQNANANIIDDWTTVLQYYVATQIDNKIPGVASVAQRSGRPLKSMKDRLNGKQGRVRGNLMGKRVDFSARSVITPDPNLSIKELGIPLKVAMNITKPVRVNAMNHDFLLKVTRNGPDTYPGAKILEKKNGDNISLRYVDRKSIQLEYGDIVHRHMMDGDGVLFNRQPTLHRMSMMCHIARVMKKGDTFRMNVGCTKPYNADFDGDEMNLHMPQDVESESELKNLAAVPYQIISPANNKSIVGIFQDSLLGSYRFTRENIHFTPRQAMNLLMAYNKIDTDLLSVQKGSVSNWEILSQILPPLTLKYKTKRFGEDDDYKTSNNVLEIIDGSYLRGQMEKGVLGDGSKGLIHRIYNDFGTGAAAEFIDDLQNIITEYMTTSSYSVGISDLIADRSTNEKIIEAITNKKRDVKSLIDQTHLGIFENNSGKTNQEEFETKINNILNQASAQAGKIGRNNLSHDNRFVIMVNAGSKGSDLNISQMISCLGQQNVDGKRIPYGFENRTLPHYTKYDDSPEARGFVESSFISGLTPTELFFHAMGGRVGLIDTAVKTSQTGYIQRRLIKGLEDLKVEYDMTVRNNKGKIVQFSYGDDGIDPVHVENQVIPIIHMSIEEIYDHFHMPTKNIRTTVYAAIYTKPTITRIRKQQKQLLEKCAVYTQNMLQMRDIVVQKIFKNIDNRVIHIPVGFSYIIDNIQGQEGINSNSMVDITPLEAFELIEAEWQHLSSHYVQPTKLFETMYYYYLSPKYILGVKRFNRRALVSLLEMVKLTYKKAIVAPGEMVGIIAAQSIGEPTTQMSTEHNCSQKIIIISKKNKVSHKSVKIGELCDSFIKKYPEYTFPTGHPDSVETLLDKLDEKYYIMGVDENEKTSWSRISHFSRHPVNGNMMMITTKSGRKVTTTLSHSHLTRKEHKVQPIKGSDLEIGMRIPVCKRISNEFVNKTVEIGENTILLDALFGWFIGAYIAEGSCNKKGQVCITNISQHYIDMTMIVGEMFGAKVHVNKRQGEYGPSTSTYFQCKELANLLVKECGPNSFEKKVPDFIFTAPIECKAACIQGYMDGDGNINCDKGHHEIRGCSRSHQLIKDIGLLLNYFDIFVTFLESVRQNKPLYHFAIANGYANLYRQHIGSVLKDDKLQELCDYSNRTNAHSLSNDVDKIEGLGDVIAKCGKDLKLPGQSRNYGRWKNKKTIGRRTLQKYIEIFKKAIGEKRILQDELHILEQAANSGIIWDEIKYIETYTPNQKNYVYDFTVPANQTFMTDNGVIIHNTLNTFHFAGVASKSNVTRGVPRIEEILSLSENPKNPSVTVYLKKDEEHNKDIAQKLSYRLEHTKLGDVVSSVQICFDPDDMNTLVEEDKSLMEQYRQFDMMIASCMEEEETTKDKSKWIVRIELDRSAMHDKNLTMDDIHYAVKNSYKEEVSCVYSDYNSDNLIFRLRLNNIQQSKKKIQKEYTLDQSDEIYLLKSFQDSLLNNVVLRGVKKIKRVLLRKITDNLVNDEGNYRKQEAWVLDTIGTNLMEILALDYIDPTRTISNDIQEIYRVLGIEAARQAIFNELSEVIEFDSTYINYHHLSILCDRMTYSSKLISIFRHGINNDDIGPIAKASFEETPEMFIKAARHAEIDQLRGISANVMCGQEGYFGTNCFQLVLDLNKIVEVTEEEGEIAEDALQIEQAFGMIEDPADECSTTKMELQNNTSNIKKVDLGGDDGYMPDF